MLWSLISRVIIGF